MSKVQNNKAKKINLAILVALVGLLALNIATYISLYNRILDTELRAVHGSFRNNVLLESLKYCYENNINPCEEYDKKAREISSEPQTFPHRDF